MEMNNLLRPEESGVPVLCGKCHGKLIYNGLGQYKCEKCQNIELDNYGKVREYLEKHPGASVPDICTATGLNRAEISKMVSEDKFQVNSRTI